MAKFLFDMVGSISFNPDKDVNVYYFSTVHKDDCEAVSLIDPDLKKGPWIAGGAPLKWYQGEPVRDSDIDVFCRSPQQAQKLLEKIKSYGRFHVKCQTENAITIEHYNKDNYSTRWTIQIITKRFFKNIQEVIDSFDITVCEIATCGDEWIMNPQTARDIRERILRFKTPLQSDSPKRLTKYWTYGYRPVEGTIEQICDNVETRWAYTLTEDYNAV